MTREEAIDIIKAERECVYRQGRTGECCRDDLGCGACDLVMEDVDIIEAYDMAIEALKTDIDLDDAYEQGYACGWKERFGEPKGLHGEWVSKPKRVQVDETDEERIFETKLEWFCSSCGKSFDFRKPDDAFCKYCGSDNRKREGDEK